MAKNKISKQPEAPKKVPEGITHGERFIGRKVIDDTETGSTAKLPVNSANEADYVMLDRGELVNMRDGEKGCDGLIATPLNSSDDPSVAWFVELKGTKKGEHVNDAIEQLKSTIDYMSEKACRNPNLPQYLKRDYVLASVVGAPNVSLPKSTNDAKVRELCQKLKGHSGKRKEIKNMFSLLTYVDVRNDQKNVQREGVKPSYTIVVSLRSGAEVLFAETLLQVLTC